MTEPTEQGYTAGPIHDPEFYRVPCVPIPAICPTCGSDKRGVRRGLDPDRRATCPNSWHDRQPIACGDPCDGCGNKGSGGFMREAAGASLCLDACPIGVALKNSHLHPPAPEGTEWVQLTDGRRMLVRLAD